MSKIQQFISPMYQNGESSRKRKARQSVVKDEDYVSMPINGINVKLPPNVKPYVSQRLIMIRLIQNLRKTQEQIEKGDSRNVLIESPTGSGKTLALLAGVCAWLADYKEKQRESKLKCSIHGLKLEKVSTSENRTSNLAELTKIDEEESAYFNGSSDRGTQFSSFLDDDDRAKENVLDVSEFIPGNEPKCECLPSLRIYYGTRTHKQIAQVVKEFSRLPYAHDGRLKHSILASREQSCLNQEARNTGDVNSACRELNAQDGKGCLYRNNLRNKCENSASRLRTMISKSGVDVWDMEDLLDALRAPQICPYYTSTMILSGAADIIFTPFNYLLDPIIRDSTPGVKIENSIVILDEAHNLEDTCREAASFQFRETEFYAALSSFKEKLNVVRECTSRNSLEVIGEQDEGATAFNSSLKEWSEAFELLIGFTNVFFNLFKDLAESAKEPLQSLKSQQVNKFRTYLADDFKNYLIKFGTTKFPLYFENTESENYKSLFKAFYRVANVSKDTDMSEIFKEFVPSPVAIVLVEKFLYFMKFYTNDRNYAYYKLNFTFEPAKPKPDNFIKKRKAVEVVEEKTHGALLPDYEGVMNFWSMVPSVSCTETFEKCYSLILASGTLRPTDTLKTELGVNFSAEMEGKQVVPSEQIFATIVPKGKSGRRLVSTYQEIDHGFYMELAWLIRDVCTVVPKGVLVFLSSYRVMEGLKDSMRISGLHAEIERRKKIFFEPNRSKDLEPMLEEYSAAIENSASTSVDGALLFAVYRGKVSEGIDFTDDMARCVICVGIPYPNAYDEVVRQKKAFNDRKVAEQERQKRQWNKSTKLKENYLTGDQWYSIQAFRALNQALGRCLRHINDWGAILLVDARFREKLQPTNPDYDKISTWVRENLRGFDNYPELMNNLVSFIKTRTDHDAETKPPVPKPEPLTPLINIREVKKAKARNATFGL